LLKERRYADMAEGFETSKDFCSGSLLGSSVSNRALMLQTYGEDFPSKARSLLETYNLTELKKLVRIHALIDSENAGCSLSE
jgi:hypothetical protein